MIPKLVVDKNVKVLNKYEDKLYEIGKIIEKNVNIARKIDLNRVKIFDLTRGKFPKIFYTSDEPCYAEHIMNVSLFCSEFQKQFVESNSFGINKLLNNIPVFVVESSMADEYVGVPGCNCSIRVPTDRFGSLNDSEFDIDEWVQSKDDRKEKKEDPRERISKSFTISDLLGVYIYSNEHDVIPRRIFIWIDKILDYAEKNQRFKNDSQTIKNVQALFDMVLYHEMAHALMDVELYDVYPAPNFSYTNDYPYRFCEEACANGIALTALMYNGQGQILPLNFYQQNFIEDFVRRQGAGYSYGWDLYENNKVLSDTISKWMGIKVLFNYDIACILKDLWNEIRKP